VLASVSTAGMIASEDGIDTLKGKEKEPGGRKVTHRKDVLPGSLIRQYRPAPAVCGKEEREQEVEGVGMEGEEERTNYRQGAAMRHPTVAGVVSVEEKRGRR